MYEIWLDVSDEIWLVDPAEPEIFHGTLSNDGWKHKAEFITPPRKLLVTEMTDDTAEKYIYRAHGSTDYHGNSKMYESVGLARRYRTSNGGKNNPNYVIQRSKINWETFE